ncbi:MAG TPA: 50S ribosomal protein L11 methyltransferase [Pyrinomonadaceae bacterium]|nr:50S ribosomal protein L11 methyltransferase [Pyrinomonadaceae bacterium]
MIRRVWYAAEAIISREASEAAEYGLMEAGALGTETSDTDTDVTVLGYFETCPDIATVRAALVDALRIYSLAEASLIDLKVCEIVDRDWLAEWKKDWQPVEVGRFIIAPLWSEVTEPGADRGPQAGSPLGVVDATGSSRDRIVIRIEPGMAFGTGTHETTRLCLKAIEKHFRGGSFLEVGSGTGILAIAAAKMFPDARVEACDTDADAIEIANENARLNGVGDQIDFRFGSVDERTQSADLVCANLTAPVIVDLLPSLLGATCGRLVLSGILDSQLELIQSRLLELGVDTLETDPDGEWVALVI